MGLISRVSSRTYRLFHTMLSLKFSTPPLIKTPFRTTYMRAIQSKRKKRRMLSESVPNLYKYQKIIDTNHYFNNSLETDPTLGYDRQKARYFKAVMQDVTIWDLGGDMYYDDDNIRDNHRTDWF